MEIRPVFPHFFGESTISRYIIELRVQNTTKYKEYTIKIKRSGEKLVHENM